MRKNTVTPMMKECITQSLLLLLRENALDEIPISLIVEKAGVNRSTYYRHFRSRQDVVRYYFQHMLDEYLASVPADISAEAYFVGIFRSFLRCKSELLLLDRRSLTYLLLDELNDRIDRLGEKDAVQRLYCRYHLGGVFNSFRYWLSEDMSTPPEELAQQCMRILPEDFFPRLL